MISFPDPGWQLIVHGVANAVLDRHHGLHVSKLGQASRLLKTLEGLPGGRGHSCTRIMGHHGNCHFHLTRKTRGIEYVFALLLATWGKSLLANSYPIKKPEKLRQQNGVSACVPVC